MTAVAAKRILDKGVLPYEDWLTQGRSPLHRDPKNGAARFRTPASRGVDCLQRLTDDRALGGAGLVQTPHGRAVGRVAGDLGILRALAQDVRHDLGEGVQ